MERYFIGDGCLCWSFSDSLEEDTVRKTVSLYKKLKGVGLDKLGVYDVVPSYKSVALHYDPVHFTIERVDMWDSLIRRTWEEMENNIPKLPGKEIVLPVLYEGDDLSLVAAHCGLTENEVIEYHSLGRYLVAMVGFKPHFPYLMGLDPLLQTPRLDSPRTKIPAGAVAIGGAQTGIYPQESPGGWNLIGKTDPELLKQVEPGDTIIFKRM